MHVNDYISFARRWVPIALILALASGMLAYCISKYVLRPVYTSAVTMQVDVGLSSANSIIDPTANTILAQTEAAIAQQHPIVESGLRLATGQSSRNAQNKVLSEQSPTVSCQTNGATALFSCSVTANSPRFAYRGAGAVANAFITQEAKWAQDRYQSVLKGIKSDERSVQQDIAFAKSSEGKAGPNGLGPLQQRVSADMTRYNGLLDKETVLQETAASQATVINLVSSGSIPTAPSSPHPFVNALVAFFLVFLLTLGGGMLTQALADEVGGEEELKELTGLPILGSIPFIPSLRKQPESPAALVMANQPRSAAAEAFRVARTSLTLSDIDRPAGTILVSSSVAEEGKTVVSANLALAFAESGVSTILVDLDLRHPSLDRIFESPNGGLTTLLMDSSRKPEDFLVGTSNPNLRVLNTGPLPPTPTELLTSERLRLTMESLRESVDLLILDSPPLLAVADARIAAGYCDAVVLVIRPDIIRRRIVTHSVESVLSTGVRVAGIVINSASPEQGGYFLSSYAYRYTHGFTRRQYGGENPGQKKALADQKG